MLQDKKGMYGGDVLEQKGASTVSCYNLRATNLTAGGKLD